MSKSQKVNKNPAVEKTTLSKIQNVKKALADYKTKDDYECSTPTSNVEIQGAKVQEELCEGPITKANTLKKCAYKQHQSNYNVFYLATCSCIIR